MDAYEFIQKKAPVTKSQCRASHSKLHYSEIISFMTEFIIWKISKVSFSFIKSWFFSRILSLASSRVANSVRCKLGASKKKWLKRICLGMKKTQKKTELSNEDRVQMIFEPLDLQLYLQLDLPLTFRCSSIFLHHFLTCLTACLLICLLHLFMYFIILVDLLLICAVSFVICNQLFILIHLYYLYLNECLFNIILS